MISAVEKIFRKAKSLVLLEPLKITRKNRIKTYCISFFLAATAVFHFFLKDPLDGTPFRKIMDILLVYFMLNICSHLIKIGILSSYRKRNKYDREHFDNLTIGISNLASILFYLCFFVVLLGYLNVDIKAFLTIFGIFFAGLCWVLKEYIVSTINGLMIMFSKNFRINDYILVNNNMGLIRNITFMHTEIKTDEGNIIYIPNNIILGSEVINFSKAKTKTIMFKVDVPAAFFSRIKELRHNIRAELFHAYPRTVKDLFVNIGRIKTGAVNLKIQIVLYRYNFAIEKEIKNFAKLNLLKKLAESPRKKAVTALSSPPAAPSSVAAAADTYDPPPEVKMSSQGPVKGQSQAR